MRVRSRSHDHLRVYGLTRNQYPDNKAISPRTRPLARASLADKSLLSVPKRSYQISFCQQACTVLSEASVKDIAPQTL